MNYMDSSNGASYSGFFIPRTLRSSSLDDALSKSDVKLEDLLDDDDFLFELKNCSPRLMDYMTKNKIHLKQLIDYITIMPKDHSDPKRAHKYPFLASEIFEAELAPLLNAFFVNTIETTSSNLSKQNFKKESGEDFEVITGDDGHHLANGELQKEKDSSKDATTNTMENANGVNSDNDEQKDYVEVNDSMYSSQGESFITKTVQNNGSNTQNTSQANLLEYLFAFLDTDDELNSVLCGYFNKLVVSLLRRNHKKMIEFVYSKPALLINLTKHIMQRSIAELILNFIAYDPIFYDEKNPVHQEMKLKTLDRLLANFTKESDLEVLNNTACIIAELIVKNEIVVDGKEMIDRIISTDTIETLFSQLDLNNQALLSNICMTLYSIISYYNPGICRSDPYTLNYYFKEENENEPIIGVLVNHISTISKLLKAEPEGDNENSIDTQYGASTRMLGSGRIKLVEIVDKLIRLYSRRINTALIESKLIPRILELFENYPWNNILHIAVEKLLNTLLDINDGLLIKHLFEDVKVLDWIARISKDETYEMPRTGRKVRKGNLGHVTRVANAIIRYGALETRIAEYQKASPEWLEYVSVNLKKANEDDNVVIGGYNPREYMAITLDNQYMSFQAPESHAQEVFFEQPFGEQSEKSNILDSVAANMMAVSNPPHQEILKEVDEHGFQAITHDPNIRSPKVDMFDAPQEVSNTSFEQWKRQNDSGSPQIGFSSALTSSSPNKLNTEERPSSEKVQAKELEDDEIETERGLSPKSPEKRDLNNQFNKEEAAYPEEVQEEQIDDVKLTAEINTLATEQSNQNQNEQQKSPRKAQDIIESLEVTSESPSPMSGSSPVSNSTHSPTTPHVTPEETKSSEENLSEDRRTRDFQRRPAPALSHSMFVDTNTRAEFRDENKDPQSLHNSTIIEKKTTKIKLRLSRGKIQSTDNRDLQDILNKIASARKSLPGKTSYDNGKILESHTNNAEPKSAELRHKRSNSENVPEGNTVIEDVRARSPDILRFESTIPLQVENCSPQAIKASSHGNFEEPTEIKENNKNVAVNTVPEEAPPS